MKIDLLAETVPSIALMNAIAENFPNDDFAEKLGMAPPDAHVDVVLTVNGVEIPFASTIQDLWDQLERKQNERATEIAMRAITGAGLEDLFQTVKNAEYEIERAIEAVIAKVTE